MSKARSNLKPVQNGGRSGRRRLGIKAEPALAVAPTATALIVLGFVEVLSRQRLLFAMVVLNVVHPPAVSTALSFVLRSGK